MTEREKALISAFISYVVSYVVSQKFRFLDYLTEVDRDPTLGKVSAAVIAIVFRGIAQDMSVLDQGRWAKHLLDMRNTTDIGGALVALDDTIRLLRTAFLPHIKLQLVDELQPFEPTPYPTLAEIRARLLIYTTYDEQGRLLFTEDDVPVLLEKSPVLLDRMYSAVAHLHSFPIGNASQTEGAAAVIDQTTALPSRSTKPQPKRGGRPSDANLKNDRRIAEAWNSGSYTTRKELAEALGKPLRDVMLALDRERHRKPSGKT